MLPESPPGHRALRKGRISLPGHVYHVTTATQNRRPLFADFNAARCVVRALNSRLLWGNTEMLAWVVMPDHVHAMIQLGDHPLPSLMKKFKSASALAVNRRAGVSGTVWQRSYHDHALRREEDLAAVARYIVANPLRAGLVRRLAEYSHWDAVWL